MDAFVYQGLSGAAWPEEQVAMIGVASNADDDAARVREQLAEKPFPFPVLLDPGGQLASSLGVFSTPTVVLLDRSGVVRFQGWMDNEEELGDDDREAYLEQALDALLGGTGEGPTDSPVYGCTVTRSL